MASIDQIINRYADQAGKQDAKFLRDKNANVFVGNFYERGRPSDTTIYSYGTHFPMAVIMPQGNEKRGWWLVNGDRYSVSTSRHQGDLRNALKRTRLPMMIVPFSALGSAGIRQETITPVHILPDHVEMVPTVWKPDELSPASKPPDWYHNVRYVDGKFMYDREVHRLGSSLFTATYLSGYGKDSFEPAHKTAFFLSAFDENEPSGGLYFLAQLPDGAAPATVAEALQALKPAEVLQAEQAGVQVLRQGDVFAIASTLTTRDLIGPSMKSAYVLGVNHMVTEVRSRYGKTFGRGMMRHRPRQSWRRPEHRRLTLGDRKTWFEFVRNAVPDGRSWSIQGNVD